MSLKTVIAMFVTCMAPIFLVYLVVDGIHILQIEDVAYIDQTTQSHAHLALLSFSVLCVVVYGVILICATMCGGKTSVEERRAGRKTVSVRQRDEGETKWFDINLLKDDVDVGDEKAKRFHFFDADDEIDDVSPESGSSKDNIGNESLRSANGLR